MKNLFPGYYLPTPDFKTALDAALIVFDTNVLINFYAWAPTTRENSFSTLRKIQHRCWLPFHVALEFHRLRHGRVEGTFDSHEKAISEVTAGVNKITQLINTQDAFKESAQTAGLVESLRKAAEELTAHAQATLNVLPRNSSQDPVNAFLGEIFEGRVGAFPDQAKVNAVNDNGKKRREVKHPPGLTDANKEGQKYMDRGVTYLGEYGDLYIWTQILEHLATVPEIKHLIFVTDENKSDWWAKNVKGERHPAPELVHELALSAPGCKLWMYQSPDFFQLLSSALGTELSTRDLAEIEDAAASTGWESDLFDRLDALHALPQDEARDEVKTVYASWLNLKNHPNTTKPLTNDDFEFVLSGKRYVIHNLFQSRIESPIDLIHKISTFHNTTRIDPVPPTLIIDTSSLDPDQRAHFFSVLRRLVSQFPDVLQCPSVYLGLVDIANSAHILTIGEI